MFRINTIGSIKYGSKTSGKRLFDFWTIFWCMPTNIYTVEFSTNTVTNYEILFRILMKDFLPFVSGFTVRQRPAEVVTFEVILDGQLLWFTVLLFFFSSYSTMYTHIRDNCVWIFIFLFNFFKINLFVVAVVVVFLVRVTNSSHFEYLL